MSLLIVAGVVVLVVLAMVVLLRLDAFRRGWKTRRTWDEDDYRARPSRP